MEVLEKQCPYRAAWLILQDREDLDFLVWNSLLFMIHRRKMIQHWGSFHISGVFSRHG